MSPERRTSSSPGTIGLPRLYRLSSYTSAFAPFIPYTVVNALAYPSSRTIRLVTPLKSPRRPLG